MSGGSLRRYSKGTTPSALFKGRFAHLLIAQPPLLTQEGSCLAPVFHFIRITPSPHINGTSHANCAIVSATLSEFLNIRNLPYTNSIAPSRSAGTSAQTAAPASPCPTTGTLHIRG